MLSDLVFPCRIRELADGEYHGQRCSSPAAVTPLVPDHHPDAMSPGIAVFAG